MLDILVIALLALLIRFKGGFTPFGLWFLDRGFIRRPLPAIIVGLLLAWAPGGWAYLCILTTFGGNNVDHGSWDYIGDPLHAWDWEGAGQSAFWGAVQTLATVGPLVLILDVPIERYILLGPAMILGVLQPVGYAIGRHLPLRASRQKGDLIDAPTAWGELLFGLTYGISIDLALRATGLL